MMVLRQVLLTFSVYISLVVQVSSWCIQINQVTSGDITHVAYSPLGDLVAHVSTTDKYIHVFYAADFSSYASYNGTNANPTSLTFNKDGDKIYIGYDDGNIRIIDITSLPLTVSQTVTTSHSKVHQIDFNEADTKMLTCGQDKKFKVWHLVNFTTFHESTVFSDPVVTCKFAYTTGHDDTVIVGYKDKTSTYEKAASVPYYSSALVTYTFIGDVNRIDVRKGSYVHVVGHSKGAILTPSTGRFMEVHHQHEVKSVCYADTIDYYIGLHKDDILFFNGTNQNNTFVQQILGNYNDKDILYCDFSPDGQYMIVGAESGEFQKIKRDCGCLVDQFFSLPNCTDCDLQMAGCYTCTAPLVCTSCKTNYAFDANSVCVFDCTSITNCNSCGAFQYCINCATGYYPLNPVSSGCSLCTTISQCLECSSTAKVCTKCNLGFYPTVLGVCIACNTISQCQVCDQSTGQCTDCLDGYFPNPLSINCSDCSQITNCSSCLSNGEECLICNTGSYPNNATSGCLLCSTISSCLNCDPSTVQCTQCVNGSYPDGSSGGCLLCSAINNCLSCNATIENCLDCSTGYYADPVGTGCLDCSLVSQCLLCDGSEIGCVSCDTGYFPDSSGTGCLDCMVQISGCELCDGISGDCTDCVNGSYPDPSTNGCLLCNQIANCSHCQSDAVSCIQCDNGWYPHPTQSGCLACGNLTGCLTCSTTAPTCLSCSSLYYLNAGSCNLCSSINFCSVCDGTSSGCIQCNTNYYPSANGLQCLPCSTITNCLTCDNTQKQCTSCDNNHFPSPTSYSCINCTNIAYCVTCDNSGVSCLQCSSGYYPDPNGSGQCVSCSNNPNCVNCDGITGDCYECSNGFYPQLGLCVACNTINQCSACDPIVKNCLTCNFGYFPEDGNQSCSPCSDFDFCVDCSQISSDCTVCQVGYMVNTSGLCELEPGCAQGYFLDGSNVCQQCQVNACISCLTAITCFQCADGFFQVGNTCKQCPIKCKTCTSLIACTSCLSGYYLDGNTCKICQSNCETCLTNTTCLTCPNGFYLSGGQCLPCFQSVPGCSSCVINPDNSSVMCIKCFKGSFFDGSSCQPCSTGCFSCNSSSHCFSCQLGMYFDTNTLLCQKCQPNCSSCDDLSNCRSCKDGFYLNGTECILCPDDNCLACTLTECTKCKIGYYLNANDTCQMCASNTTHCSICHNNGVCLECQIGYLLTAGNSCQACSETITGCFHCLSNSTCQNCIEGYYFNSGSCSRCSQGCKICNNSACFSCENKYFMDNTGPTCKLCYLQYDKCQTCSSSSCLTCVRGYYFDGVNCSACQIMPGCISCRDQNYCRSCSDGYYLKNNDCQLCSNIEGCLDCTSQNKCILCQPQLFLNSTTNKCDFCSSTMPGCLYCSKYDECDRCINGYFLNQSSLKCETCSIFNIGCIYCLNQTTCLQCEIGYFLNSTTNLCQPCNSNCESCSQNDGNQCLSCGSQYYMLVPGLCRQCKLDIQGCIECHTANQCNLCQKQFYKATNNTCQRCSQIHGCRICHNQNTCKTCQLTYYLNSNSSCNLCRVDLPGCLYCQNSSYCLECEMNYFRRGDKCVFCEEIQGCKQCRSQGVCTVCQVNYYLLGEQCVKCSEAMPKCSSCLSSYQCMTCEQSYTLTDKGQCKRIVISTDENIKKKINLKTRYIDNQTLKHSLLAVSFHFNTKVQLSKINWNDQAELSLILSNGTIIDLDIIKVEWGNTDKIMQFYTNNPLNMSELEQGYKQMPFTRRQLLSFVTVSTTLHMAEQLKRQIMPQYNQVGPLYMQYPLQQPEFYDSITKQQPQSYLYLFGMIITLVLLIKDIIKALKTVPNSPNLGHIIPHIFALKTGALILYPTYSEYVQYCYGFMTADFPWFNKQIGVIFGSDGDLTPYPYKVYYTNLNIASTYLLTLCVLVIIGIIILTTKKFCHESTYSKLEKLYEVLYSFFCFGFIFASCICFQGGLMNPTNSLSINAIFYILGIGTFFFLASFITYKLYKQKSWLKNIWQIRVFLKAILLSLSHFSPIPILSVTLICDLILISIQYKQTKYPKLFPILWLTANILTNIALLLIVVVPNALLSIIFVSLLVLVCLGCEIVMHKREGDGKLKEMVDSDKQSQVVDMQDNIFIGGDWQHEKHQIPPNKIQKVRVKPNNASFTVLSQKIQSPQSNKFDSNLNNNKQTKSQTKLGY